MSETVKLSFDDGYKTIEFNNDPDKVIRINPTDVGFIHRLSGLEDKAKELQEKYGDIDFEAIDKLKELSPDDPDFSAIKLAADNLKKLESAIRELIDSTFENKVCDIVFGETSCLSPSGGMPIYLNFIRAIFSYINEELAKQNAESEKRMSKYTKRAESIPIKPAVTASPKQFVPYAVGRAIQPDISSMSQAEKDALLIQLMNK